jgi:hypothetical protein
MRIFSLVLVATCLAAAPAEAMAQAAPSSEQTQAARRADEYAANRVLIGRLTMERDSLGRQIAYRQRDLRALLDWQQRCQAAPADCPPPPGPPLPMAGMAPGHAAQPVPQISLAQLQRQRATIAQLREEIRDRTDRVGRLDRRIAELRGPR